MMACAGGDYRRRWKRGAGFRCALNCDSDAGTRAVGPGAGRCGGPHVPPRCPPAARLLPAPVRTQRPQSARVVSTCAREGENMAGEGTAPCLR